MNFEPPDPNEGIKDPSSACALLLRYNRNPSLQCPSGGTVSSEQLSQAASSPSSFDERRESYTRHLQRALNENPNHGAMPCKSLPERVNHGRKLAAEPRKEVLRQLARAATIENGRIPSKPFHANDMYLARCSSSSEKNKPPATGYNKSMMSNVDLDSLCPIVHYPSKPMSLVEVKNKANITSPPSKRRKPADHPIVEDDARLSPRNNRGFFTKTNQASPTDMKDDMGINEIREFLSELDWDL